MKIQIKKILVSCVLILLAEFIILLFSEIRLGGSIYNFNYKGESWYLGLFTILFWVLYLVSKSWAKNEKILLFMIYIIYFCSHFIGYLVYPI